MTTESRPSRSRMKRVWNPAGLTVRARLPRVSYASESAANPALVPGACTARNCPDG